VLHSRVLQFLQYADAAALEPLQHLHREWNQIHAQPLLPANPPRGKPLASKHPLRLGFVSADFGTHPVAFLTLAALENLDKTRCSITCYSDRTAEDHYTRRFRAASDLWRSVAGWTDEEIARQVRDDQIDVLIDLAGHHGKRLLVFARKPAPLQLTWAGYVGTTGLVAMDGLIADRFHVLPAEETFYCEQVLRMPHSYICYLPPEDAPPVAPLPAQSSGRFTFGSFNNFAKCGSIILDVWAEILRREPNTQLLLKSPGLQLAQNQVLFIDRFGRRGIGAERILFEGSSPQAEHLAAYGRVDLALDTLPYSGGVTTCDALWMGVPVVSCPGPTFAGRHSTSHLSNAGFSNFVAADLNGYVELARYYVHHPAELAAIRAPMRETMRASPLCDAARFASDFLALLTQAWQTRAASSVVGYASS
jgi:protein O-GlcNAc transferase